MERDLVPHTIIPYRVSGSMVFRRLSRCLRMSRTGADVEAGVRPPYACRRHAPDVPRRRRHGHRLEAPARGRRPPDPGRLRPVSGAQGAAAAQLGAAADRPGVDRRRHPDARAPRSLRLSAAAGRAGLSRAHVLHAGDEGSLLARAARRGAHPGRGRARREPARLHEAPAGAAALHDRRRRARAGPAAAGRLRPPGPAHGVRRGSDPGRTSIWPNGRVHQRRAPARVGVRPRQGRRQDDPLRRRPRPLRPAGAAGPVAGRRGRRPARRVHLRRSAARGRRRRRSARGDRQRHGARAAAS